MLPLWTVAPFALYLLVIAFMPLAAPRFWEHNRNKLILAVAAAIPVILYLLASRHGGWLLHSAKEYVAFIALLASLYIIAGGIHVRGSLDGTPFVNTAFLGLGGALASLIGTTGASMLLIRPLLRANQRRPRRAHIVIFFIFIVANGGGMLTPLGDPPLFLGFLRGVPFTWTFRLALPWLLVNSALLVIFHLIDRANFTREEPPPHEPLRIEGALNALWLAGVVGVIFTAGQLARAKTVHEDLLLAAQVAGMLAMAGLSMATTPKPVRAANKFTWGPIVEVAVIFLGIFATMVPALKILEARGGELGLTRPWQYFWATGALSSFLDNAPTYLTFASLAAGSLGLSADNLGSMVDHPQGALFLAAVSCGAVFMGANTYIGNGPNFMVKAIAEENGVKMPSFFGYMAWSGAVLIPLFIVVTFIFFR